MFSFMCLVMGFLSEEDTSSNNLTALHVRRQKYKVTDADAFVSVSHQAIFMIDIMRALAEPGS